MFAFRNKFDIVHYCLKIHSITTVISQRNTIHRWVAPTLKELKKRQDQLGPQPEYKRSSFLEWNYSAEIFSFGKRLKEDFNEKLLIQAFTNKSYIIQEELKQKEVGIENPSLQLKDNEALAESGERFMKSYISSYIRKTLPYFPEEGISAIENFLMEERLLAQVSLHIGTKDLILSEEFPVSESVLALTLKAVVGALMESSGKKRAGFFVRDFIITQLSGVDVNDVWKPEDPEAALSEILARSGMSPPESRLISQAGRNTILASYEVGIYSEKKFLGHGFGESIKTAEIMAAHDALKRIFRTTDSLQQLKFDADVESDMKQKNMSINEVKLESLQNVVQC